MAGQALTTTTTMMCPHGGTVTGVPAGGRVSARAAMLTASDLFTIAGCSFYSPCVTVRWVVPDAHVKLGGAPSLSTGSTGLCLGATQAPQGQVSVVLTQPSVSTR